MENPDHICWVSHGAKLVTVSQATNYQLVKWQMTNFLPSVFWDSRRWKSGLSIVVWDCGRWKSGPCLLGSFSLRDTDQPRPRRRGELFLVHAISEYTLKIIMLIGAAFPYFLYISQHDFNFLLRQKAILGLIFYESNNPPSSIMILFLQRKWFGRLFKGTTGDLNSLKNNLTLL